MGVGTGGVLCVSCPDGGEVEVVVPDGVRPGDTFEVSLRDETSEEATAARAAVRAAARRERGANLHQAAAAMEASGLLEQVMQDPVDRNAFGVMLNDPAARFMHGITLVSAPRPASCRVQHVSAPLIRSL